MGMKCLVGFGMGNPSILVIFLGGLGTERDIPWDLSGSG